MSGQTPQRRRTDQAPGPGAGAHPDTLPRPLAGFARALRILFGVMTVLSLACVWSRWSRASVVDDWHPSSSAFSELTNADDRVLVTFLLFGVGQIITAIAFITWQYRHARNAVDLGVRADSMRWGWAIGGWFIPCANYVVPAVQLHQASRASTPGRHSGQSIVVWWAILYGVGSVAMSAAYSSASIDDPGSVAGADQASALGFLILAAAAVVAARMVTRLSVLQAEAWRRYLDLLGPNAPRFHAPGIGTAAAPAPPVDEWADPGRGDEPPDFPVPPAFGDSSSDPNTP